MTLNFSKVKTLWVLKIPPKAKLFAKEKNTLSKGDLIFKRDGLKKELKAPCDLKVVKIEKGKVFLEFTAREIRADFKSGSQSLWARFFSAEKIDYSLINAEMRGKIIIAAEMSPVYLKKATVVGVKAILYLDEQGKGEEIDLAGTLPVLIFKADQVGAREIVDKTLGEKVFLDSKKGVLLIPTDN